MYMQDEETIEDMKASIEEKKGIPKSRQVISYKGKELKDSQKVNKCDFSDMLNVTLRLV